MTRIIGAGGGCFKKGTYVRTPDGARVIESLKEGDSVVSFDDKGELHEAKVLKVHCRDDQQVYQYKFWGGDSFVATPNHWVLNQFNSFTAIGSLGGDDCVVDVNNHLLPIVAKADEGIDTVYNLTVEGQHTFIANNIRVHNAGIGLGSGGFREIIGSGGGGGDDKGGGGTPRTDPDSLDSKSYANVLDLISEGECHGLKDGLKSVFFNNTPLQNGDGSSNFENVTLLTRTGTGSQTVIPGFGDAATTVSVNQKIEKATPNIGVNQTVATSNSTDKIRVILRIPALQNITDKGDIVGTSVTIKISLKIDSGAWDDKVTDTISGRTGDAYKKDYEITLPDTAFSDAKIRVLRESSNSSDPTRLSNDTWWDSYVKITHANNTYNNSALIATRVWAEQFQTIPQRSFLFRGIKTRIPSNATVDSATGALIYSGIWNGTFAAAQWNSDPCWSLWDLLTSQRYGLGDHILTPTEQGSFTGNASRLDKWAFYSASQYCSANNTRPSNPNNDYGSNGKHGVPDGFGGHEPRFSCNVCIKGKTEAFSLINAMASVFRGMPYWSTGSVTVTQDKSQTSSYLFTLANVTPEGFTYSGSSQKTRTTVAVVKYFDNTLRSHAYEEVKDAAAIAKYGAITKQVEAFACTSRGQANRVGKWLLYSEGNETETVTFSSSIESGVICRPGQVIDIADPVKSGVRRGGRIKSVTNSSTIVVDDSASTDLPPNSVSATRTLHVISPTGIVETRTISDISGSTVTVSSAFDVEPQSNCIWVIETTGGTSAENVQTTQWKVVSVAENEGTNYQVTALSYNSSKYSFIEQGIALTQRDFTNLNELPATPGEKLAGTYSRTGTTITVTITGHGFTSSADVGRFVCLAFSSGNGTDNSFAITAVPDANTLTFTDTNSGSTSGNLTLSTLRAFQQLYTKGNEIKTKIIFSWDSILGINEYEVRWRKDIGNWSVHRQQAPDDELRDVTPGTYQFKIFSLNAARVPSTTPLEGTTIVVGKTRPPSQVTNFTFELAPFLGLVLHWDKLVGVYPHFDDLDVAGYEIRTTDAHWALTNNTLVKDGGNLIARVTANSYKIGTIPSGTQAYFVKAFDSEDIYSATATSQSITIGVPNTPAFDATETKIEGESAVLVWAPVSITGKYGIDYYEVYKGGTTPAHLLGQINTTRFTTPVMWSGDKEFHVKAVDIAGNASAAASITVTNTPASAPTIDFTYVDDTLVLNWSEVNGSIPTRAYEIRQGSSFATAAVKGRVKATEFTLPCTWTTTQTFWVVAVNTVRVGVSDVDFFGTEGTKSVSFSLPGAPSVSSSFVGENVRLTWSPVTGSLPVSEYEIKRGNSSQNFADAHTNLGRQDGTTFTAKVDWGGINEEGTNRVQAQKFWVRAVDVRDNAGAAADESVSIGIPDSPTAFTQEVIDNNVLLRWSDATDSLPIIYYSIKRQSSTTQPLDTPANFVARGTDIGAKQGKFTTVFETTSGTFTYWIAGIDSAGNVGETKAVTASVNQPPDYVLRSDINSDFSGTKTNVFTEGGRLFANVNTTQTWEDHFDDMSWTTLQDQETASGGIYNIYALPSETSGSYVQEIDHGTVLAGTKVVLAMTAEHAAGQTTITPTISVKETTGGSWTDFPGSATTDANVTYSTFATNFRFVKYTLAFTSSGNDDLLKITALNLRLETKQKGDAGVGLARLATNGTYSQSAKVLTVSQTGHGRSVGEVIDLDMTSGSTPDGVYYISSVPNANSFICELVLNSSNEWVDLASATNSGNVTLDSGGTAIAFNTTFVDLEAVTITPSGGTTPRMALYDFVDAPNPKIFKAFLYDTNGTRVGDTSGTNFSWQVRGS